MEGKGSLSNAASEKTGRNVFFLFSLDGVFTSGLTQLFQLLSLPHKGLEFLGGCLPNWSSEVKLKGDEHCVPMQLVEL